MSCIISNILCANLSSIHKSAFPPFSLPFSVNDTIIHWVFQRTLRNHSNSSLNPDIFQQVLWTCPWNDSSPFPVQLATTVLRSIILTTSLQSQLLMIHCQKNCSKTQIKPHKCPAENPSMILPSLQARSMSSRVLPASPFLLILYHNILYVAAVGNCMQVFQTTCLTGNPSFSQAQIHSSVITRQKPGGHIWFLPFPDSYIQNPPNSLHFQCYHPRPTTNYLSSRRVS